MTVNDLIEELTNLREDEYYDDELYDYLATSMRYDWYRYINTLDYEDYFEYYED